jgi:hypothetical protein
MPNQDPDYQFRQAHNLAKVAEQEYGTGPEIMFTTFTSCIGLLGFVGASQTPGYRCTGVHLVMVSDKDKVFDPSVANRAAALLGVRERTVIIGCVDLWAANVPAGYQELVYILDHPTIIQGDDGLYGGRVYRGVFQTYQRSRWVTL